MCLGCFLKVLLWGWYPTWSTRALHPPPGIYTQFGPAYWTAELLSSNNLIHCHLDHEKHVHSYLIIFTYSSLASFNHEVTLSQITLYIQTYLHEGFRFVIDIGQGFQLFKVCISMQEIRHRKSVNNKMALLQ